MLASCAALYWQIDRTFLPAYIIKPRTFSSEISRYPSTTCSCIVVRAKFTADLGVDVRGPELTQCYKVSAGNPITADYGTVSANGFAVKVFKNVNRSIDRTVNDVGLFAGWPIYAFRNKNRTGILITERFYINE